MTTSPTAASPTPTERQPATWQELHGRSRRRRRYGRSTLTILRWGPHHGLLLDNELAETLRTYEKGEATAEDVGWAYARSRIVETSPSFIWDRADLGRLIELVSDCSEEEPVPRGGSPDELTSSLLEMRETQRARMAEMQEMALRPLQKTFRGLGLVGGSSTHRPLSKEVQSLVSLQKATSEALTKSLPAVRLYEHPRVKLEGVGWPPSYAKVSLATPSLPNLLLASQLVVPAALGKHLRETFYLLGKAYRPLLTPSQAEAFRRSGRLPVAALLDAVQAGASVAREEGVPLGLELEEKAAALGKAAVTGNNDEAVGLLAALLDTALRSEEANAENNETTARQNNLMLLAMLIAILVALLQLGWSVHVDSRPPPQPSVLITVEVDEGVPPAQAQQPPGCPPVQRPPQARPR
jgi:hypothetical protein